MNVVAETEDQQANEKSSCAEFFFPAHHKIKKLSNFLKCYMVFYVCDFGTHWLALISISQLFCDKLSIKAYKKDMKHGTLSNYDYEASYGS